jgi:hypothetical protein
MPGARQSPPSFDFGDVTGRAFFGRWARIGVISGKQKVTGKLTSFLPQTY